MTKEQIPVDRIETCNSCGSGAAEVVSRSRDFQYDTCSNEFSFVRCKNCGLVYLRDRPAVSTLDIIYPPNYGPYNFEKRVGSFINKFRDFVQSKKIAPIIKLAPLDAVVVDVGCGGGALLRIMRRLGPRGWRLVGVDLSDAAIRKLADDAIEGRAGRFETMEWNLASPDVIVMNQVIEHLDNPSGVVRRSFELLKPGGILLVETPSVDAWDARLFWDRHWGGWHTPRHWTLYTPDTLSALAQGHGFELVEVKHILSPTFWLQSVNAWMIERPALRRFAGFFDIKNFVALTLATSLDYVQLWSTGKTSNFRLVARKPARANDS